MKTEFESTVSGRTIKSYASPISSRADVAIYISPDADRAPGLYTQGRDILISAPDARAFSQQLYVAANTAEAKVTEWKREADEKAAAEKKAVEILAKKKAVAEAEALKPKTEVQILREALQKISTDTYCFPRQAAKEALKAADDKVMITLERTPYTAYAYLPNSRYLSSFVD